MNRVNFGVRSRVIADQCREHGVWLDGGELKELMDWKKAGGQLLHEKRTAGQLGAKQREQQRKKREHNTFIGKSKQQSSGIGGIDFTRRNDHYNLVDLIFKMFQS